MNDGFRFLRFLLVSVLIMSLSPVVFAVHEDDQNHAELLCSEGFQRFLNYQAGHLHQADEQSVYAANGWQALVDIFSQADCISSMRHYLEQWMAVFSSHEEMPAVRNLLASKTVLKPKKVAILLEENSQFAEELQKIKLGIEHAAVKYKVQAEFFSTASASPGKWSEQIRQAGHQCIIGPLLKHNVIDFADAKPELPVLALNHLPELMDYPLNFFQIALAPEDQVKALIGVLKNKGLRQGLLFKQEQHSWSQRMAKNIYPGWLLEEGSWAAVSGFSRQESAPQLKLSRALEIDQSQLRADQLQQLLGEPLEYEPRRRQDVDFVVFIGEYEGIRHLYPYLRYWQGHGIPAFVLSPSLLHKDKSLEHDLDGLNVFIPAWLNQKDLLSDDLDTLNLFEFGYQAMAIAINSGCLQLPSVYMLMNQQKLWYLQTDTGQIGYKTHPAVILNNRLKILPRD